MKNKHPVLRRFMRRKVSVVAAAVLIAILGPLVWQVDPLKQSVMKKYGPMTVQHPLGTDNLGRDTLARMIYGARVSLAISFAGVLSGALIGVLLGVSAGYFGGWVDAIISRFIDILLAFPGLLLAITIVAVLGPGSVNTVIAITIFTIPGLTRMVRSVVLSLKSSEYVEACKTMGESNLRIILTHVIPNSMSQIIVNVTLSLGTAILTASSLSFLGLGVTPPEAEWGAMLSQMREVIRTYPTGVLVPGNGKEMTSADVVASLNRWLECFGTARKMVGDARFTVVDDYTVSLTLDHSAIMLLDMLAGAAQAAVIYPVESIEAVNADTGYVPADYIIGTGPYMFKEWAVDQYVLLERFDDYAAYGDPDQPIDGLWGYKHAYTKTLKYWIVKDAATRFNGLMSGEYDFIVKATDAYLGTLRSMPDITCYSMQTGMINLVWNKHSTDKYLRLAFQALANADDLNTANYGSLYDNDPCFMEKSQPGWYTTKGEEFFCQNDPEKAKELLAQSSFDTSKPLRILTATGGGAEAMLEVLRQEAAKIGVTLEITATDRTTMTSMRNDETLYDAYFTTFSSVAVPSLRNFLSADYAGWSDDEHLQELMLQMTTAATKEAAFATWEEIQYYCYSDYCPILMMGHFHQAAACTNRLTGYNVFLTTNFWNAKLAK